MNLGAYRLALDAISQGFRASVLPLLRVSGWDSPDSRGNAVPEVAQMVREYRRRAAEVANEYMASQARAELDSPAFIPAVEGYPDEAVAQVFRESRSLDQVADGLTRHVETGARRQVVRAVPAAPNDAGYPAFEDMFDDSEKNLKEFADSEESWESLASFVPHVVEDHEESDVGVQDKAPVFPVGWARVPTGAETCAFCFMLASRGPVYSSLAHAERRSTSHLVEGRDRRGRKRKRRIKRISDQAYHDNCDCVVAPVYSLGDNWPGKEQYLSLSREWDSLAKSLGHSPSLSEWRSHVDGGSIELPDVRRVA